MGKQRKQRQTLFLGGSKITADGDCSPEIKRSLLPEINAMTNLDSILKGTDITLPTKVRLVKAMVFPVVMYGCWELDYEESWASKNWGFWTVVLENIPRRSNLSILKEISPEYSLEELSWTWNSNTLATWCEELTHLKRPWCWERLKVGGEGEDRGWNGWMASPTPWTRNWVNSRSWWWTGKPRVLQFMGSQRVRRDWTEPVDAFPR